MKHWHRAILIVVGITWALWGSPLALAQEAKGGGLIQVPFATGEYRPYTSETMPGFGASAELVSAICQAAGIQPEFKFYPWKRAEIMLAQGAVFGAFPYSENPTRKQQFNFSDELYRVSNTLVYYDRNPAVKTLTGQEKLADLKGLRFGIIAGSFAEPRLKELGVAYEAVATADQLVQMLRAGRIDIYIDDEATIFDAVKRVVAADAAHFHALATPFDGLKANNVMVSRAYPNAADILKRFNAGLARIKKTGEYDRILAKYHLQKN